MCAKSLEAHLLSIEQNLWLINIHKPAVSKATVRECGVRSESILQAGSFTSSI